MKKHYLKTLICTICFIIVGFTLSGCDCFKEHTHNYIVQQISPTETSMGYDLHSCNCGDSYQDNYTCLITYENISNNTGLPQIEQQIVSKDSAFESVASTTTYAPKEYRVYKTKDFYTNVYPNQAIINSCKISIVWETISTPSTTQTTFNELIAKIAKLEEISKQYNVDNNSTANPQIRAMQYIRQTRYATSQWNMFGGTIESDFSEYVSANQGSYDLSSLQSLSTFTIPSTQEQVDFVHMVAIMNVLAQGGLNNNTVNDLVGWGGDLCQLALELKGKNLSGDELNSTALTLFNSSTSSFSNTDLCADLDAINLVKLYNNLVSNKSISYAMQQYYNAINVEQRKTEVMLNAFPTFINSETGTLNKTQSEMVSEIISRLNASMYIKVWCMSNSVSLTDDIDEFTATTNAFVSYLIS